MNKSTVDDPLNQNEVLGIYILAGQLAGPALQNECLRQWRRLLAINPVWSLTDVKYVYNVTWNNPASVLRHFIVDSSVHAPKEDAPRSHKPEALLSAFYHALIIVMEEAEGGTKISNTQWARRSIAAYKSPPLMKTEENAHDPAIVCYEIPRGHGSSLGNAIDVPDDAEDAELATKSKNKIDLKARSPEPSRSIAYPKMRLGQTHESPQVVGPVPSGVIEHVASSLEMEDQLSELLVPQEAGTSRVGHRKRSGCEADMMESSQRFKTLRPGWLPPVATCL